MRFQSGTCSALIQNQDRVTNEDLQIERLVIQITEYLSRNPLAADTLDGIQSWWLSGAPPNISAVQIENAIQILLQRRVLQCNEQSDGTKTYSRAHPAWVNLNPPK